jgi:hypothetical protein
MKVENVLKEHGENFVHVSLSSEGRRTPVKSNALTWDYRI